MLKRNLAVLLVATLVLGVGATAWAGTAPGRPTLDPAAAAPDDQQPDKQADRQADRQAKREALRQCVQAAGDDVEARRACTAELRAQHLKRAIDRRLGGAVHGELLVPAEGGGYETVTFDRGKVNPDTDETKIVLDRPDGQHVTVALTPDTRYRGIDNAGQLQDGKGARVVHRDGKAILVFQGTGNKGDRPGVSPGKK